MRGWLSTVLAAVVGGGVTAAALLGAGAVDDGDSGPVTEASIAGRGAPALTAVAGGGLGARAIYKRDAPGVVFVRAQTLPTDPSPFDVVGGTQPTVSTAPR